MALSTKNAGGGLVAPGYSREAGNMRIKILRGTVVGGERVSAGAIVEATGRDAKYLISTGKAEEAKSVTPKRAKAKPAAKANASD